MPEHTHYEEDDLFNPETSHEHTDVPTRPLFWFFVIFAAFGIVSHFVVLFLHEGFARLERKQNGPPMTAVQRPESERVPTQPLLQPFPREDRGGTVIVPNRNTPVTDMVDMRNAEEQVLRNYGWVDQQKGIVRMPIQVAKDLIAQRGLPRVATPPPPLPAPVPPTEGDPNPARLPAGGAQP